MSGKLRASQEQPEPSTLGALLYADEDERIPSEQQWTAPVRSIAGGDQPALDALYERAHRPVFTLLVRLTGNRQTAEELTLDVSTTSGGTPRRMIRGPGPCSVGS